MRLKAFSVIELLVVLSISGLIVSFAAAAYGNVLQQYLLYKGNQNELSDLKAFQAHFQYDFNKALSVQAQNESILLSTENKSLEYIFAKPYILRKSLSNVDTLSDRLAHVKSNFQGQEISYGLIDELHITCALNKEQSLDFHYYKSYAADVLLSIEEDGGN